MSGQPTPPTLLDRLMQSLRALIRAEFPNLALTGIFEYAVEVVSSDGTTADCVPTDSTLPLPPLVRVPLRPGLLGESATLTIGARCFITFINNDPARPALLGADGPPVKSSIDAKTEIDVGPSALLIRIGGSAGLPAARTGDAVVAGPFAGSITGGSLKTTIG